jgi:hypothetical protein
MYIHFENTDPEIILEYSTNAAATSAGITVFQTPKLIEDDVDFWKIVSGSDIVKKTSAEITAIITNRSKTAIFQKTLGHLSDEFDRVESALQDNSLRERIKGMHSLDGVEKAELIRYLQELETYIKLLVTAGSLGNVTAPVPTPPADGVSGISEHFTVEVTATTTL